MFYWRESSSLITVHIINVYNRFVSLDLHANNVASHLAYTIQTPIAHIQRKYVTSTSRDRCEICRGILIQPDTDLKSVAGSCDGF